MSCPYYWWNNHYACRKSGKDVNEDTYYKYCRNYDYDDCPIYKGKLPSDSGNCYLSTACIEAMNLPDDCYELTILRRFRDEYVLSTEAGKRDISHYYTVAPLIVSRIKHEADAKEIFGDIYVSLIIPCVELISTGKNTEAYRLYKSYSTELEQKYLELY